MNRANKEIGRKENREHIAAENGILFREDKEANQTRALQCMEKANRDYVDSNHQHSGN